VSRSQGVRLQIVAHRGATAHAPENTRAALRRAHELGADAVELDVRLSVDGVPVVYHYAYLEAATIGRGPVWSHSLSALRARRVGGPHGAHVPTLAEVLDEFTGRLGLETELKGPEPEAVAAVVPLLEAVRRHWRGIDVTSFEPVLLAELRIHCPDLSTALLYPRSEAWPRRRRSTKDWVAADDPGDEPLQTTFEMGALSYARRSGDDW